MRGQAWIADEYQPFQVLKPQAVRHHGGRWLKWPVADLSMPFRPPFISAQMPTNPSLTACLHTVYSTTRSMKWDLHGNLMRPVGSGGEAERES